MNDQNEKDRLRVIGITEKRGDFVTDVDGYVYYWPSGNEGHLAAHHLRWLADELDRRNKGLDDEVNAFYEDKEI